MSKITMIIEDRGNGISIDITPKIAELALKCQQGKATSADGMAMHLAMAALKEQERQDEVTKGTNLIVPDLSI